MSCKHIYIHKEYEWTFEFERSNVWFGGLGVISLFNIIIEGRYIMKTVGIFWFDLLLMSDCILFRDLIYPGRIIIPISLVNFFILIPFSN